MRLLFTAIHCVEPCYRKASVCFTAIGALIWLDGKILVDEVVVMMIMCVLQRENCGTIGFGRTLSFCL